MQVKRHDPLRRLAVLPALLACLLLCGCTVQSVPLGRRAMVRLIYLEQAGQDYRALTVVCDFSGGDGESTGESTGAALVQTATAPTLALALEAAAGAQGGKPFFAQNSLLLLQPALAQARLDEITDFFAADCGSYRDPAVWLWSGGADALTQLEKPMDFIRLAETLTQEDPHGCVQHILQLQPGRPAVLPRLRMTKTADEKGLNVTVAGLHTIESMQKGQG